VRYIQVLGKIGIGTTHNYNVQSHKAKVLTAILAARSQGLDSTKDYKDSTEERRRGVDVLAAMAART
jgi:hypothetical protein